MWCGVCISTYTYIVCLCIYITKYDCKEIGVVLAIVKINTRLSIKTEITGTTTVISDVTQMAYPHQFQSNMHSQFDTQTSVCLVLYFRTQTMHHVSHFRTLVLTTPFLALAKFGPW